MTSTKDLAGTTVGHYAVLERLGAGGMGIVYKARDTRLNRYVALKFLPPTLVGDEVARARFIEEAQTASALDHAHVCTVYEIGETPEGHTFISMAYCPGETLKERILRGPLAVDDTVEIAIQVTEGLLEAHEHGIAHRDMKPANVILTRDGKVRIVDFGLATLVGLAQEGRPGVFMGTLAYMSPEQLRGEPVDHRSDIWSMGITIFEMLAGAPPFGLSDADPLVYSIQYNAAPALTDRRPDVPERLATIVSICLEKDRTRRFRTAVDLHTELVRCRQELDLGAAMASLRDAGLADGTSRWLRDVSLPRPGEGAPRRRGAFRRALHNLFRW